MSYRLAIVETHPIQYKVPWFRLLHERPDVDLTVFYCMLPDTHQQGDGFGLSFEWDIPLLEGYTYRVLENRAAQPSVTSFFGCDTPDIRRKLNDGWDAVIVNGWVTKSCIQTLLACRRLGIPCIVRGESNNLRSRAAWKRLIHRVLLHQYSACLYIGQNNRQFYRDNGVPDERLFFAPYCIETERFAQACESARMRRNELRQRWGIPEDSLCFVFSGKFIPKKRPGDILSALQLLQKQHCTQQPHLLMVGDGELRTELEATAKAHALPVSFTGFLNQSQLPEAYAAADCMILPSDNGETWGLVVNEAMACGLPAIISDQVGCHSDLIIEGTTGFTYPCGNPNALAMHIHSLMNNPQKNLSMGKAAKKHITAYSYQAIVDGTLQALHHTVREAIAS